MSAELPSSDDLIDVDDFVDDDSFDPPPARPPGPGLLESIGWVIAVFFFQIVVGMIPLVIVFIIVMSPGGNAGRMPANPQKAFEDYVNGLTPTTQMLLFGLPNALAFVGLIGLGLLRLRPAPLKKLNFSRPSLTQTLILCSAVLPLGLVADVLFQPAENLMQWLMEEFPEFSFFEALNVMEFMAGMQGASLLALLFCVAVVPAIGEEFMFRGLIGRGLVARWGVVAGVLIASVLFAGMHMYPPHVLAVFPLGILMHIAYLTTRSFWAPMMVHFINNGIACLYTSIPGVDLQAVGAAEPSVLAKIALAVAPFYVLFCCYLLWVHRTQYVDEDGVSVWPLYRWFTADHVEGDGAPQRRVRESIPIIGICGAICLFEFVMLGWDIFATATEQAAVLGGS